MATKMDQNQYTYLSNLASGKTATGGVANAGQRAWAKAQLANVTPTKTTTPKATSAATTLATKFPTSTTTTPNTTLGAGVQAAAAAAAKASQSQTPTVTPFVPRLEQTVQGFQKAVNTPFTYDPNSDQAFQAYKDQALKALALNQNNTTAQLYANGQGDSSYSEALAHQMANSATKDISNQMINTYLPQAYKQYQDNLANQQNLYNMQYQQDVTLPQSEAVLTGKLPLSQEARQALEVYNANKQQAEAPGITAENRDILSAQNTKILNFLKGLGIDTSGLGPNVSYDQAVKYESTLGTPTLAAREADLNEKQANLDAANIVSQNTGRVVMPQEDWTGLYRQAVNPNTPQTYDAQYKDAQLQQDAQQFAQQMGYNWANLSQDQQQFMMNLAQRQKEFNYQVEQDKLATPEYSGLSANQIYQATRSMFEDGDGKIPTDPKTKEQIYLQVGQSGLPMGQDEQVMTMLGLTAQDILNFDKKYGVSTGG